MAMDVVQGGRLPVNRCLFGRPSAEDQASFTARLAQKEREGAERFSRDWNFDVFRDGGEVRRGGRYQWIKGKSASDSDLPEFYCRSYSHHSRRRALTPSAEKSLTVEGEGGGGEGRAGSPVQYMESSSVEVYLGVPSAQPLRAVASVDSLVMLPPPPAQQWSPEEPLSESGKITGHWPKRKRARSLTPPVTVSSKRERPDSM